MAYGSLFGWSLPAGCGTLPGEEPEPPCVDCPVYLEEWDFGPGDLGFGGCIIGPHDEKLEIINRCPIHNLITECWVCKGPMGIVYADVPQEHFGDGGYSGEPVPCCSVACKEKQDIAGKAEMREMLDRGY